MGGQILILEEKMVAGVVTVCPDLKGVGGTFFRFQNGGRHFFRPVKNPATHPVHAPVNVEQSL